MFQEIAKVGAVTAAGMVGVVSVGNAAGRIFWAWVSDAISRRWTFVTMFLIQGGLIWGLPGISSVTILTAMLFVILMCYGGGVGTIPAFAAGWCVAGDPIAPRCFLVGRFGTRWYSSQRFCSALASET